MNKNHALIIGFLLLSIGSKARTQDGWFYCTKCSNLYFAATKGVCAAGGDHAHEKSSGSYTLSYGTSTCKGQSEWYWCTQCSCLFFGLSNVKCVAGDKHVRDPKSKVSYIICYTKAGAVIDANHQSEWYHCSKYSGLFFGQNDGVCPGKGKHFFTSESSGNYVLAHY
jgi:hypothetical protein